MSWTAAKADEDEDERKKKNCVGCDLQEWDVMTMVGDRLPGLLVLVTLVTCRAEICVVVGLGLLSGTQCTHLYIAT